MAPGLTLRSVLVTVALIGCGDLSSGNSERMGRGNKCIENLGAVVDEDYLLANGLEIRKADAATIAVGGAIAEVCIDGPASMSIEDGAQRVVEIVRKRYAS